jgi:hypothetical protein
MDELLPSNRVFLIRLSSVADPSAGIHRGRIEHIRSGKLLRFSSLDKVEEFISQVLSEEEGGIIPAIHFTRPNEEE